MKFHSHVDFDIRMYRLSKSVHNLFGVCRKINCNNLKKMNFRRSRARSHRNSMNIMVSTERWRSYSRKLSRRNTNTEENSEDDIPKTADLKDWMEELFSQKNVSDHTDQDVEVNLTKKQTLILSTLVPDEILLMDNFNNVDSKRFVGVLMMADVSGYTALSEKYNNTGKSGTYRLTVTLNTYLGSLIEVIYSHGGDIIKFAGDAFLALWKTDKRTFLSHTIHTAIACALIIQHSYGSYETDVKVNLKVKLAISAGNLIFAPIGSGIDMNYIIVGLPVFEAKMAESRCASGEVKLTPTAWGHCYSRNYDHVLNDDGHVTIKSILYDPHENDVSKPFLGFAAMIRQVNKPYITLENFADFLLDDSKNLNTTAKLKRTELLSLRKTILVAEEKNIGAEIRKFMIRPVLTQIDAHQPLEYLTEMRQVSILFITLKPKECSFPQLITIVNNSYQITSEIVYKSMGCVNKIILFDKDIMILAIFGLRGFKHESEAQAALKCANSVKKSVSALEGVLEVSIGVTTGQVYCGVVGHPLRREFTVIGAIVNKAARFMCGFRNKITCDEATFVKSKMSSNGFTLQQPVELKGIIQPGKIFEYSEEIRVKELFNIPLIPPLLNRHDEMGYFEDWINDHRLKYRDFDALLLIGESRIGKSRLLEWMTRFARNRNFNVCHLCLTSIHSATPYLALSQIVEQIIGFKDTISGFEKEERIVNLLKYYSEDLCYLNDILKVRFAYHEGINSQDDKARKEKTKRIFKRIIDSLSSTYIIFLDDLQNLDSSSWEYLSLMFQSMKIFTVFTVTRGKFSSAQNWLYAVFINNNIRKVTLGCLNSIWIAPLACQILDVHAVSKELYGALKTKCNGIPGLVESFLVHLFSNGALEIKKIQKNELENWTDQDLQFPEPAMLLPVALNSKDQVELNELLQENMPEDISICFVTQKEQLNIDLSAQNVDALIMMQIDSLTPYQQLLLKIASVIGNVLSRDLLESIMYENNPLTTAKAIKRLFAMRILCCANVKYSKSSTSTLMSNYVEFTNLICDCEFDYDSELNDNLPKYAFCKVMKFKNKKSRKTYYELLPLNQKKEFHSRIVNYLENNKQKCSDCGGVLMVVQSTWNIQPQAPYTSKYFADMSMQEENMQSKLQSDCERTIEKISQITNNMQESMEVRRVKSESLNKTNSKINMETISDTNITKLSNINLSPQTPILKIKCDDDDLNRETQRRSTKRVTMTDVNFKSFSSDDINANIIFNMLRAVTEAKYISEWHNMGAIDSEDCLRIDKNEKQKKSFCINLEKGVSQINFNRCSCTELNIIIHEQLIHHAQEAEMNIKAIEFLIRYCYLNILENNFELAIPKLQEAENTCLKQYITKEFHLHKTRFLGKIYSLKAAAFLLSGNLTVAQINIDKAARIYRINLRKISDIFQLQNVFTALRLKQKKYYLHNTLMRKDSIFFLNVATVLYSTLDDESTSRIAALRSLYLIQKVKCNIVDICDTFANAIQLELNRGVPESTVELEKLANRCLENTHKPIQGDELFAVGKLFLAIFRARAARGQLAATIRSGFRALVVSRFLGADKISIDIIPDLFYCLLSRCRIKEAIDVVKLLTQLGENHATPEFETWYYALCIDIILDAGFQLESPYEISRFAEYSIGKGKAAGEGRRRLIVGLWTYWLRVESDQKAKRYETEALNWLGHNSDEGSMKSIISGMRLAEGMLESLAKKVDDLRKVVDLMELRSLADRELTNLEKDIRLLRAIYPRWLLLKGNSLSLSGRKTAATSLVNQALEEARKVNNRLEEALALATNSNSKLWIQNARKARFPYWNASAMNARTSWHKFLYNMTTKSL